MTYPFDLGTHSRPVSSNSEAQIWFDRGLVWLFGFNHEEAIACFEKCLAQDESCALAHWAIAYALGPNYNKPWDVFPAEERAAMIERGQAALEQAISQPCPPEVRLMIDALTLRMPETPEVEDFQPYQDAFAAAMREAQSAFPDDLDLIFFAAEAMMNRTPWRLWDFWKSEPNPEASTLELQDLLDTTFERPDAWQHPGLLHLYIHMMEMSPHPEKALRHGDVLTGLVPDAGHLVHMASHIDVLCGDYQNVVERNLRASAADEKFKAYAGGANFYALYRIHNLHFALYGAMFQAQKECALACAERLRAEVPDEVVRVYPDLFETFVASRPHVLIRFGLWSEILEDPLPEDLELYAVTHALMRYARAIAFANLGQDTEARNEAAAFEAALAAIPEERYLFQNKAHDVLMVAEAMMWGEILFKGGDRSAGLAKLRSAVERDDGLFYEEPWAWPQPARHALGALLMEAGDFAAAEDIYRADLGLDGKLPRPSQNPRNIWALHGLHECLEKRGEMHERVHIKLLLDQAAARADIPIRASCLCRST